MIGRENNRPTRMARPPAVSSTELTALAHCFAEGRQTSGSFRDDAPFPSRLLECKVGARMHACGLAEACSALAGRSCGNAGTVDVGAGAGFPSRFR
ncbi:MAG: hypothetical protein OXU19_18035 [bacterium]|nr:hypothetical protein [bacterium]